MENDKRTIFTKTLDNIYFYMHILSMQFIWHETKRKTNLKKHGFDFAVAEQVFSGPTATIEDEGPHSGEQRFNTTGLLGIRVVVVTHTETESEIRIISMREAEKHEIKEFFSYL